MNKKNKLFIILLILTAVLIWLNVTVREFIKEKESDNIEELIGVEQNGAVQLSMRENITLKHAVELYLNAIRSGDYTMAYNYLSVPYRNRVSLEKFTNEMSSEENKQMYKEIKGIIFISHPADNLLVFRVDFENGESREMLLLIDETKYYIVPEKFLEYHDVNIDIKKKGVTYLLTGYQVDLEKCFFYYTITNKTNDDVEIVNACIVNEYGVSNKANNANVIVPANQIVNVVFEVDTNLDFPDFFEVTVKDGSKQRIFTFEL